MIGELTFREYLIAHAPPMPPEFDPTYYVSGPDTPPELKESDGTYNRQDVEMFRQWTIFHSDYNYPIEDKFPDDDHVHTLAEAWRAYYKTYAEWNEARLYHKYFAWPIFYADQVLARLAGEREAKS